MRLAIIDLDWLDKEIADREASNKSPYLVGSIGYLTNAAIIAALKLVKAESKSIVPHIDSAFHAGYQSCDQEDDLDERYESLEEYKNLNYEKTP